MKTVKHLLAFLMIILLSVFLCSCSQSAKAHAEKAIKKDLDLLKNLDSETTMQYISYQELFPDSDDSTKLSADIKEVFSLFFQNFDYKILGISVDSDEKMLLRSLSLLLWMLRLLPVILFLQAFRKKYWKPPPVKKMITEIPWSSVICSCTSFSRITRTVLQNALLPSN